MVSESRLEVLGTVFTSWQLKLRQTAEPGPKQNQVQIRWSLRETGSASEGGSGEECPLCVGTGGGTGGTLGAATLPLPAGPAVLKPDLEKDRNQT